MPDYIVKAGEHTNYASHCLPSRTALPVLRSHLLPSKPRSLFVSSMTDPLSVTTGAIALLQAGTQTVSQIHSIIKAAKDERAAVESLTQDVRGLEIYISELDKILVEIDNNSSSNLSPLLFDLAIRLDRTREETQEMVEKFDKKKKSSGWRRMARRVTWVSRKQKIIELMGKIRRSKEDITSLLVLKQRYDLLYSHGVVVHLTPYF